MTVMNNCSSSSKDRNNSRSDLHKPKEFSSENGAGRFAEERDSDIVSIQKLKVSRDLEADQESIGSSEEMESPRSVVKVKKWPAKNVDVRLHIQILRIREEDLHLGYDIVGYLSSKDKVAGDDSHVGVVMLRRSMLPASPLGAGERTEIDVVH